MTSPSDEGQFVAMKLAEAWETYQELLPSEPDDPDWTAAVPWHVYEHAVKRIARRLWARQQRRDQKRPDRTSLETLRDEPADPRADHVRALVLRDLTSDLLRTLTDHQRRVLELSAEHHLTYEAIAKLMDISPTAVKEALRRARACLNGKNPGTFAD